jgi:hypothetical protein
MKSRPFLYVEKKSLKETLINSVLRANRCVAVVLKPLCTLSTRGLCAPRALRFIPQNQISQHFLN